MSLNYLLDGYNIIKTSPELAPLKLETGRLKLIQWIETRRPQGSLKNTVTVVFDGQPDVSSPPISTSVNVIFTSDETADERIKELVQAASSRKQSARVVVVTDDRDIGYYVKALGARVLSVKEFFERSRPHAKSEKPSRSSQAKRIPVSLEYEITSELEKLWLHEDDKDKT